MLVFDRKGFWEQWLFYLFLLYVWYELVSPEYSFPIFKTQTRERGQTAETSAYVKSHMRQAWLNSETIGGQTKAFKQIKLNVFG